MKVFGSNLIAVAQSVETGLIDVIAECLNYREVLLVQLLLTQGTIFGHDHVHRDGLLVSIVGHRRDEVPPARDRAAFAFLR